MRRYFFGVKLVRGQEFPGGIQFPQGKASGQASSMGKISLILVRISRMTGSHQPMMFGPDRNGNIKPVVYQHEDLISEWRKFCVVT